ncbi:MAG: DUF72 domain-containing protein [Nitrosopumilus sp.]|uniref:DUF72 domain-containing protein n=1 Tax=Nitrosopumilus sp. TaxID=2024843 RepID=UPI002471CD06|nr:DUF72 domain-containing protein [Nitrosopumilus sp.]MDH5432028.1 DUF72 domain-containing protein [Nitrosopumilus sp.]MDH5665061.1 DUF72 domain-containing protein [Nitrosopumilus sp.]MDH5697533.1 DUF72 domain-containing protein [Nitrosopumilus sp.]
MNIKIGCTGWSYEGWSGTFYPKNLENSKWLKYYSQIFEITEINSTFYKISAQEIVKRWNKDTSIHFRFTAKFPSIITHEKRLDRVNSEIFSFLASLSPIHEKVSALVLQLPPSLSFEEAKPRLDELFDLLPDNFVYPIEGRHESWFSEDAIEYLKQNRHCLVWNKVAGVNNPMPITSNYLYIRLIGDRSISDSEFGRVVKNKDALVANWAKKLEKIKNIPLGIVMINNHFEGFSPHTANSLRMKLGMRELIWEGKKQKTLGNF